MRTLHSFVFLFATLTILLFGMAQPLQAQEEQPAASVPGLPIAIIDMKAVRQQSTGMESIRGQISNYRSGFQAQIQQEEEQLRAANQELARQRTILTPDAFAEERKKFETRLAEVQRLVQKRRQELDQLRDTAMVEVQKALNEVIAEIASERGIILVLQRGQTILAARSLEITAEVIERLNKKIPNVVVPPPGN